MQCRVWLAERSGSPLSHGIGDGGPAAALYVKLSPRPQGVSAGFTLLEVLVVLVVLGFLFVGLAQGSRVVMFASDRQTHLLSQHEDFDAVDRTLRYLIKNARPGSEWEPLVFVGTPHSVRFTSIMPVSTAGFLNRRADVELVVDATHRLLLVWTPHLHATRIGPPPPAVATQILQGVERLELTYWAATQGGGWTSIWRDSVPPRLVRIGIVFSNSGHPPWPDIVAAPMLDPP